MSSFDQVIKNILTDIFGSGEQEDVVRPQARPSGLGAPTTSLRPRRRPDQDDADEEAIPSGADSASRFIAGMADFDDTPEEGVDIPLATLQTDARNLNGKYRTTAMQLAKLNKGAPLTDGGRANVKVAGVVEDNEVDDILAEVKMVMDPLASARPRARPKSVEEIQAIRKEQRSYTKIDSTRDLQTALNAAGITVNGKSLVEDGIMGKNTRKAIKSFQEREGLKVDGIAGPNTKQALRSVAPYSPIVESLLFDTRPSLAREDQIAGENRFSDALINERLLSSAKSEDVTEPDGLMTREFDATDAVQAGIFSSFPKGRYLDLATSTPAKLLFRNILGLDRNQYLGLKPITIDEASFKENELDHFRNMWSKHGEGLVTKAQQIDTAKDVMKVRTGKDESALNLPPEVRAYYSVGDTYLTQRENGDVILKDMYDYNIYTDYSAKPNKKGEYPVLSTEKFEEKYSTAKGIKDTLAAYASGKIGFMSAVHNTGFLLGSRDYKNPDKDEGTPILINLGNPNTWGS